MGRGRWPEDGGGSPPLPFLPGEVSNGEFVPRPPSQRDRWIADLALARVGDAADRLAIDRRTLLQSAAGMAAMLAAVNLAACSDGDDPAAGASPGGTFTVPPTEDVTACEDALGDRGEFIFDVHTHHVVPDGPWRKNAPRIEQMIRGLVPADCMDADRFDCLNRVAYLTDMFLASDTTMSLLSDVPGSDSTNFPVPFAERVRTQDFAASLAGGGQPRVLVHDVIAPNFGNLSARLDGMATTVATGRVAAFKTYTAWGPGGRGYELDDPKIGLPVIERARSLGVKVICAHKGLPLLEFDQRFNGPRDLVHAASQFPDMQFVVYHSAYERETTEGAYDPRRASTGINSLVKAMQDYGVGANSNVWAELGTTWREVMSQPTEAAHVMGKLLKHVGEDRVLWGTDAIWYGSPQPQIMAFRAFQISTALQERHGYPALTDTIKRKVFGLNAAQLFGVDPDARRCVLDKDELTKAKAEHRALGATGELGPMWRARGPITRREMLSWLGRPGTSRAPF